MSVLLVLDHTAQQSVSLCDSFLKKIDYEVRQQRRDIISPKRKFHIRCGRVSTGRFREIAFAIRVEKLNVHKEDRLVVHSKALVQSIGRQTR